jgi:hypothetical protein
MSRLACAPVGGRPARVVGIVVAIGVDNESLYVR